MPKDTTAHRTTTRARRAATILLTTLVVAPTAVWATDGFDDVPASNVFHDDIGWLADTGVTKGCNPPENTRFCPTDEVTREQMAAFLRRLAEGGVVDAATAGDADLLDGRDGVTYERPIAMRTGSSNTGTATTVDDGEIGWVELAVPAAGTVVLDHSGSWWSGPYELEVWMEPRQPSGERCDGGGYTDPEAVEGTRAVLSRSDEATQDDYGQVAASGWVDATAGQRRYSLCIDTFAGNPNNLEWSMRAAWYPASAATTD